MNVRVRNVPACSLSYSFIVAIALSSSPIKPQLTVSLIYRCVYSSFHYVSSGFLFLCFHSFFTTDVILSIVYGLFILFFVVLLSFNIVALLYEFVLYFLITVSSDFRITHNLKDFLPHFPEAQSLFSTLRNLLTV